MKYLRIKQERIRKYAELIGGLSIPLAILLFAYLQKAGAITILSYSWSPVCAGTEEDFCWATITFKANTDIYIYPSPNNSWLFSTDKKLKLLKVERKWGKGWREIKLNKSCNGRWCGCYWCDKNHKAKYSYVFRKGRTYIIRFVGYKYNPYDDVKWSFGGKIDPLWKGVYQGTDKFIIGDNKTLEPKVTIRISKDKNASFKLIDDEKLVSVKSEKKKLILIKPTKEIHLYDLGYRKYQHKGQLHPVEEWSFEQEIILKKKPNNNTLKFEVSINGLKYEKQGNTYAFYREIQMPEWVPEDQREILKEYTFYLNPVIVRDKQGKETKAKVDLKNRILTIEIDKGFLDKAICPISVDPSYTVKTGAVAYSTAYNFQRKLARKSNGDLWCVYYRSDGTHYQIYASYSTDGGETWTEEQVCSGSNDQYLPSIAIDSNDNIHVVWMGKGWGTHTGYFNIQYRKRTSSGWQTQEAVTNKNDDQYYPSIAIDSNDNIHVVWMGKGWGTYTGYFNIQYRKRTSSGWQTQEAVTNKNDDQYYPSIAIDSNDNIHVVWMGKGWGTYTGYFNIQYRKRTSSGWQTQEAITDKNNNQYYPSIAIDSNDNIHVVWYGKGWGTNTGDYNIQYRKRTSSGWQTQEGVTDKNNDQYLPSIAIDSNDNIHVVWYGKGWGTNTGYYNIQYRKRTSSGWQTQEGLTDEATNQQYPNLIWALHPTISGAKTNRPKTGYAFVWMDGTTVKFYKSSDLDWDTGGGETTFSITLNSPPNQTTTDDSTPDFNFTVSGTESSYSCELFINDTGYGTATANNNTATVITANQSLSDGTYDWYINCSANSVTNQSEVREITISTGQPDINYGLNSGITFRFPCNLNTGTTYGQPEGQNSTLASIWCENNGTDTGNFQAKLNQSLPTGWWLFVANSSTGTKIELNTSWQTFYWNVASGTNVSNCAWFWNNCSAGAGSPHPSVEIEFRAIS